MIVTKRLNDFLGVQTEIEEFERIGGCKTHRGKSSIIPSTPEDEVLAQWIRDNEFWEEDIVRNRGTYLGVLFGNDVSTEDVYKKALSKFQNRLESYIPVLRKSSLQKRITIVNVFALPLFSYLHQFYAMHDKTYKKVQALIQKAIIPCNGTAFRYIQLIAPLDWFGFVSPIKDVWATNISRLIDHNELS